MSGARTKATLPAQPNQSVMDGLACLQAIAAADEAVGIRQLARELGMEVTRAHRLVKTLAHLGYVAQTADRRYVAGPAIHVLSATSMYASGLIRRSLGPLEALSRFGLVVAMGVLWRDHVSYLYHQLPGMTPAEAIGRVGLFPAEASAIGQVLLAAGGSRKYRAVAKQGYALVERRDDGGESAGGRRSLAVAVGHPAYAGIALAGAIDKRRLPTLVKALDGAARRIENDELHQPSTDPKEPSHE